MIDRDFRHLDLYWSWELLDWHLHLLKREGNIFFRSDIQSLDPFIICCFHNVDASGPAIGELALCLVERAASLILGLSARVMFPGGLRGVKLPAGGALTPSHPV